MQRRTRLFFLGGVVLLSMAAAIELAYGATELFLWAFPPTTGLGPEVGFALQAAFFLGWGLLGTGLLLVVLAIVPRSPRGRGLLLAGGISCVAGGVGVATSEILLYYALFIGRAFFPDVEMYSIAGVVCWGLLPLGLALIFLGVLRGATLRLVE